jgi:preprotein translocase subunit SecB
MSTWHDEDDASASLDDEGESLLVRVHFGVTVSRDGDEVLAVGGGFDLRYKRQVEEAEVADDDIQLFAKINGVYNCWPYIREVVSSMSSCLGYPPFTLDSLVIAAPPESSEAPAEA